MGSHENWLREHNLGYLLDERPSSINSETCKQYSNPDKGECNPNCPFIIECTPYFEDLAKALEKELG